MKAKIEKAIIKFIVSHKDFIMSKNERKLGIQDVEHYAEMMAGFNVTAALCIQFVIFVLCWQLNCIGDAIVSAISTIVYLILSIAILILAPINAICDYRDRVKG